MRVRISAQRAAFADGMGDVGWHWFGAYTYSIQIRHHLCELEIVEAVVYIYTHRYTDGAHRKSGEPNKSKMRVRSRETHARACAHSARVELNRKLYTFGGAYARSFCASCTFAGAQQQHQQQQ